jgi:hypothetical protein
MLYYFVI